MKPAVHGCRIAYGTRDFVGSRIGIGFRGGLCEDVESNQQAIPASFHAQIMSFFPGSTAHEKLGFGG